MKLKRQMCGENSGQAGPCPGARRPFLVFALLCGGCTFESQGLPVLDVAPQDGRHDSGKAERHPDASGKDLGPGEPFPKAERRPDAPYVDYRAYDSVVPDKLKDIKMPDAKAGCPAASTGAFSGLISSGTPQFVGGYRFDYLGKSGTDAVFDISCSGSPVASGQKCPLGSGTVIAVPADGKKITITPSSAGASVVNTAIKVENP